MSTVFNVSVDLRTDGLGCAVVGGADTDRAGADGLIVQTVLASGAASTAGVRPHDIIVAINGITLKDRPHKECIDLLTAEQEELILTIVRPAEDSGPAIVPADSAAAAGAGADGSRRDLARAAFKQGDVEASKAVHERPVEKHTTESGAYVQAFIFGGLDGIVTTFAIVAGIQGANYDAGVILVLGLSNMIADATSMGLAEYMSELAEHHRILQERSREVWEFENHKEGEVDEMVELYEKEGFSKDEAKTIINLMANHKEFFIDHMMVQELGMMLPSEDDPACWKKGLFTFFSFLFWGIIPLLAYMVLSPIHWSDFNPLFLIACILTGISLFVLGVVKSKHSDEHWFHSGMMVLINGGIAAGVAYGVGVGLEALVGSDCG